MTAKLFQRKVQSATTTATGDGVAVLPRSQQVNAVSQIKTFSNKVTAVISLNRLKHFQPLVTGLITKNLLVTPLAGRLSHFNNESEIISIFC